MTAPVAPKSNLSTAQSDPDSLKINGHEASNGHDALDLAGDRLEARRVQNERARVIQRARFEEQMRQLEADHLAEESHLAGSSPNTANGNTTSAPTTPPGRAANEVPAKAAQGETKPGPIGSGREAANGAKSMPASRRASGYGGSFGLEKLSLSVMEGSGKGWEDEDVDAEGAQNSVKYLALNDDDPFPGIPKESKRLSANSAALDLAPLSHTPPRASGQRPFETSLKTSDWSQYPQNPVTSPLPHQPAALDDGAIGASRKTSPTGMADSIASLPAIPSKSVPGTPFGLGGGIGNARRNGNNGKVGPGEGLSQAQRGFSNPDLARAYGKNGGGFQADGPKPYGADPIYANMFNPSAPLPPSAAVAAAFTPQSVQYDPYGFDEDGYGSGALYPGGPMGMKNKRADTDREFNRFSGVRIEDLQGELLNLCKDQHGCRYLQKKLEEGDSAHRDLIFHETYGHFPELMTDPFGNYLCQKLLEYSTEEQRSAIIESVSSELVGISLNMHGTRAVQKMVDFLASPRQQKQIRTLIYALSVNVVALIKDLNGNHVIQKCLNKLIPEDNQFIYNAIAANLIEVATHRHGCCVLQRSIDHASPAQRVQLVTEIIFNSLYLVQDPFGNYVIQYILDLNDARFSEPLIRTFIGNVCSLSVQKFSSNVIEKCIRVADPEIRKALVAEVLNRSRLEKLLRDSYGNYVIQTILDYCDMGQRMVLIEAIRPILPSIRNTPYGKRIQSKLAREDASFSQYNYAGPGGPQQGGHPGGRGGYRGGGQGYQRHLGRPQLQHINALTEVYGSQGPFIPPNNPAYGMHPQHAHAGPHPGQVGGYRDMGPSHNGVAYHAPGPDGQPWLHLRGPAGGPAPNWNVAGSADGMTPLSAGGHLQENGNPGTAPLAGGMGEHQVLPDSVPASAPPGGPGMWSDHQQFMPFNQSVGVHGQML